VNSKPAIRSIPLTWGDDLHPPAAAVRRRRRPLPKELTGYAVCFGCVLAATAATRLTWPLVSRTPFVLFVLANYVAARYGNETGALLAVIASAFGAGLAMPSGAAAADPIAIIVMVSGSLFLNRIVIGRNHVETALRASEAQFRAAWDNSTFGAALLNRRGMVERINPAMERTLGYPSAAWGGVSFGYFSHPDDQAEERARFTAFIDGDEEWYHREQRYRRADGGIIWCRATMSATHDGNGGPRTGALMVLEDVTRRRRAEDDLRKWESRYRGLFEQAPLGLFQCAVDGRLLSVNAAFLALVGHAAVADVRGSVLTDFIAERVARSEIHDALTAGGRVASRATVVQRKGGGTVPVVLDLRPVRTDEGVVEYLDGSAREA
jgi:PAS domain S-box-containing protein